MFHWLIIGIIFNNAIPSQETIYIQANYTKDANKATNDVYNNNQKSLCMWLNFGAATDHDSSGSTSWLGPICQTGPVTWRVYTDMKCSAANLIAEKTINTNFTSNDGLTSGGTVYCVVTSLDNIGNQSDKNLVNPDSVTCIGSFSNFTTPYITLPPVMLTPFYSWYSKYGNVAMGTVFGASV